MTASLLSLVAAAFAVLFALAVLGKVDAWRGWTEFVAKLPLPIGLRSLVRIGIPLSEAAIVAVIVIAPPFGLFAGGTLLAFFGLAVLFVAVRLPGERCNCFGALAPSTLGRSLGIRNLLLAAVAVASGLVLVEGNTVEIGIPEVGAMVATGLLLVLVLESRRLLAAVNQRTTRR